MAMALGLKDSLPAMVRAKFVSAKAAGAVTFAETHLAIVNVAGVPFHLRYCPALANKPQAKTDDSSKAGDSAATKKRFDPFENPNPDQLIADIPHGSPTHALILNKFPIIPNHFILATRLNKPQTHALEEDDLWLAYCCLQAWEQSREIEEGGKRVSPGRLFAFFNSGEHSGASQPHRHIQFLPIDDMKTGSSETSKWSPLIDLLDKQSVGSVSSHLPFTAFTKSLPQKPTPQQIHETYKSLFASNLAAAQRYQQSSPRDLELHAIDSSDLPLSYNMAMTTDLMAMCARRAEGKVVKRASGSDLDFVALNGTLLGGTLMVKNDELWHLLQEEPHKLQDVLEAVGIPPGHERSNNL